MSYSKVDRDFAGGIYLRPLGESPCLDDMVVVSGPTTLRVPLRVGNGAVMEPVVGAGQRVEAGQLLARGGGFRVFAPRGGVVGQRCRVWAGGKGNQPALALEAEAASAASVGAGAGDHLALAPEKASREAVLDRIEQAGIVMPDTGEPLVECLGRLEGQKVLAVVANANPLEPDLTGPLAIMRHWPEQVFAGLAILKRCLGAADALVAYPVNFEIDLAAAEAWQVRCLAVSEKYPQGRSDAVLRTLARQRHLPGGRRRKERTLVLNVQMLREVERALFGRQMPTERVVTVSGDGVERPLHFAAPVGLALAELLEQAGLRDDARCVAEGSSLAGFAVEADKAVICPTSESFTVIREVPSQLPQACIRCGWCLDDCPAGIDPARLLELGELGQYQLAWESGLEACTECGICSHICPSHLRIMEHIRMIKSQVRHGS